MVPYTLGLCSFLMVYTAHALHNNMNEKETNRTFAVEDFIAKRSTHDTSAGNANLPHFKSMGGCRQELKEHVAYLSNSMLFVY